LGIREPDSHIPVEQGTENEKIFEAKGKERKRKTTRTPKLTKEEKGKAWGVHGFKVVRNRPIKKKGEVSGAGFENGGWNDNNDAAGGGAVGLFAVDGRCWWTKKRSDKLLGGNLIATL